MGVAQKGVLLKIRVYLLKIRVYLLSLRNGVPQLRAPTDFLWFQCHMFLIRRSFEKSFVASIWGLLAHTLWGWSQRHTSQLWPRHGSRTRPCFRVPNFLWLFIPKPNIGYPKRSMVCAHRYSLTSIHVTAVKASVKKTIEGMFTMVWDMSFILDCFHKLGGPFCGHLHNKSPAI